MSPAENPPPPVALRVRRWIARWGSAAKAGWKDVVAQVRREPAKAALSAHFSAALQRHMGMY